ncbi:protein of unknown function [Thermoactinomyces sp. DSM 45891]|uniref:DUF4274 domain-containing protein n=1 Tax=Thermoactinomyces sp. DSM 45891 TaxID=1761907 RepID=UPI0009114996|nr:DUF4274 domain-containing protein [Thermoactinomyces sp. DSM 45891]SFX47453.1 protein of unknown function [Thermoactinomyces sp. DSM 45891]
MDSHELERLSSLIHHEDLEYIKDQINKMKDSVPLHLIAGNYNWDNGVEIPTAIINNDHCDLGTALMIFFDADGYRMLDLDIDDVAESTSAWKKFLDSLYKGIVNDEFNYKNISYAPPLSKVQVFKLRKKNPDIPDMFLQGNSGMNLEIPTL